MSQTSAVVVLTPGILQALPVDPEEPRLVP